MKMAAKHQYILYLLLGLSLIGEGIGYLVHTGTLHLSRVHRGVGITTRSSAELVRTRVLRTKTRKLDLQASSLSDSSTKYMFVGGKGGVGKTTTSSAIAVGYSDMGKRTLIVSTDPAHSLGDALAVQLQPGVVTPIVTEQNLWALEVDIEGAIEEFKKATEGLDLDSLANDIGIPRDMIEGLGVEDLTSLFKNPPPGIDEIVALLEIFKLGDANGGYDKIVIDTAPTGHTLRLLELPEFLDKVTGNLIRLRGKLTRAITSFKTIFGGAKPDLPPQPEPLQGALEKLEGYQRRLSEMRATLKDAMQTQFVVVTIPTNLAVAETTRLVKSLRQQGISVGKIVCNQVIAEDTDAAYMTTRVRAQRDCISQLESSLPSTVEVTEVPYSDAEVLGPYGLKFFASLAHPPKAKTTTNPISSRKLTIFGGKGGVGKTTSAASWGLALAEAGLRTLVVSTDPAHSLGDALMTPLDDQPKQIELPGATTGPGFSKLWAMEIDPDKALDEFREAVGGAMGTDKDQLGGAVGGGGGIMGAMGLPDLTSEVMSLVMDTENPPPGTDEIVAMSKVMSYLDEGLILPDSRALEFDRIVLDTAPTGHTLRMLTLPTFLQDVVEKVRNLRDSKAGGMLGGMMKGEGGGGGDEMGQAIGEDRLTKFQKKMERLEDVLHNPSESEFSIVTIPTQLATSETKRLVDALAADSVSVRRVIVNQVLPVDQTETPGASEKFFDRVRKTQTSAVHQLEALVRAESIDLLRVPFFDTELVTVFGLRLVSQTILQ